MTLPEAFSLARDKYFEEQAGRTDGPVADRFRAACTAYPALMAMGQAMWAREFLKGLS